jgi:Caspase recruitment domain
MKRSPPREDNEQPQQPMCKLKRISTAVDMTTTDDSSNCTVLNHAAVEPLKSRAVEQFNEPAANSISPCATQTTVECDRRHRRGPPSVTHAQCGTLADTLQKLRGELKSMIEVDFGLLDELRSGNVLSPEQIEDIQSEKSKYRRVDHMLTSYVCQTANGSSSGRH